MSNLLRTIQQVTRDYVDSISHRLPSIKNGTVTATSSDGTATVRVDGDAATTASVPSIATVKTGDRVKMLLFNRQLTILGAIKRTDKLVADTIAGGVGGRNLALNSNPSISTGAYNVITGRLSEPWVEGATYTVTIKGSVNTPNQLRLYRDTGMAFVTPLTNYDAKRGVYTATFVCPPRYQDRDPYEFSVYNYPSATATSASIEWIKIERGSVATDWTLAPEDCQTHDEYLHTTTSSQSINIGSRNSSHCHYETTAPSHYFNKNVLVNGEINAGSGYNKRVWHDGNCTYHGNASNGAVRYENGVQIAWLAVTTNTSITTAYGPAFQTTYTWTFAVAFSSTPAVSCGRFQHGSSASWGMTAHISTMNQNTQALLRGMDFFSRAAGSTTISAIAVGRWK